MNAGYITVPRDIADHWLWTQPRRLKMWMQLVFMANWEDGNTVFGSKKYDIKRGQFSTTMRVLAGKLCCTKQTLLTFLEVLEQSGMIKREMPGNKFTIITIVDYEIYQAGGVERSSMRKAKYSKFKAPPPDDENNATETDVGQNIQNNEPDDYSDKQKSDRKLDHIKEKRNSLSPSRIREQNKKNLEELNKNENFWQDLADGLGMDKSKPDTIPKLKNLGIQYMGEQNSKGKEISPSELPEHLFNWIRRSLQFPLQKNKNLNHEHKNGKTETDSRRGFDAPPPESPQLSKSRF